MGLKRRYQIVRQIYQCDGLIGVAYALCAPTRYNRKVYGRVNEANEAKGWSLAKTVSAARQALRKPAKRATRRICIHCGKTFYADYPESTYLCYPCLSHAMQEDTEGY